MKTSHYYKKGKSHFIIVGIDGAFSILNKEQHEFTSAREAKAWAKAAGLEPWNY